MCDYWRWVIEVICHESNGERPSASGQGERLFAFPVDPSDCAGYKTKRQTSR